jgi:hypothetical protein
VLGTAIAPSALLHPVPLGKLGPVEDTWTSRDLPVLDATVALLENRPLVDVTDIAARAGLTVAETSGALQAMEGVYVELAMSMGGPQSWSVQGVTPAARRAVGQWPSAESLITRLVEGLNAAADQEANPERKSRLRQAASLLGGAARDIATDIAARFIEHSMGLG